MKRFLGTAAALFAVIVFLRGTGAWQPPPAAPSSSAVTVLVTLGLRAADDERWDGTARVTGGALLRTEGRQFSAGDAITGPGTWKAVVRRDEVAPFADIHYTEIRPGDRPPVLFHPVGVYLTVEPAGDSRVEIQTAAGRFGFVLSDINEEPKLFLDGRVSVVRVPTAEKLSTAQFEDDEPSIAVLPDGSIAVAWVAYRDRSDRVLMRIYRKGSWSVPEEVTPRFGEIFRTALAVDEAGELWAFWSELDRGDWQIWARRFHAGAWGRSQQITSTGSNTFLRAASAPGGPIYLAYQSFREGQSDIYLQAITAEGSEGEVRISESPANDWEPAVAAGPDGTAYVVWDSYDRGNYDVYFRWYRRSAISPVRAVTSSPRFQAHADVTVDAQGRPWVAWDESGVNWGKDQGFLIPTPLSVALHQERTIRLAMWDGSSWQEPRRRAPMMPNAEHPHILFDGAGSLALVFRHWTRRNDRTIGSPMGWDNYATRFDGSRWSTPAPLAHSTGHIEKNPALAREQSGAIRAAWMTDNRPFSTAIPENADIYTATLGAPAPATITAAAFEPMAEKFVEAIPVHTNEPRDVEAVRGYTIATGGRRYRIFRGDMHRHTDFSQDFKYDGSLLEVYRYALDAAGFDYIAPTDHQAGYDQEFTWWLNQKLVDLFFVPGRFAPLYAYERSLPFPNGHRNVIFAHPGVRTLPLAQAEVQGREGAAKLYDYLRRNGGISMPHSSATNQGTDWRDNDPKVEPLIEIYQGYRNSYEYEGAPRAATSGNLHAQKSGWQPSGFWWNALAKGYKLGVQASSDHWSTHMSYACIVAENFTREGLLEAMRKRHAYAATDNIILDVRARAGGETYIMGDAFVSSAAPQLSVRVTGTNDIKQIDVIKNQAFIYTVRPASKTASFEFTDRAYGPGESYYYVRVLQEDGQLAWSSPLWARQ